MCMQAGNPHAQYLLLQALHELLSIIRSEQLTPEFEQQVSPWIPHVTLSVSMYFAVTCLDTQTGEPKAGIS